MPVPTATPSATAIPKGDGVLTVGTLFPTTGENAMLSRSQSAGVELAVREINETGGVNGEPVMVFHKDSGDASTTKAEESFDELVARSVDVVIGPASSVLAERLLPKAISAGVAVISPSATSPALSGLHDNSLLFRTIPSQVLEGVALAAILGPTSSVAVIYNMDDASVAVRDQLEAELKLLGASIVASEGFTETVNDADTIISVLNKAEPEAVVLISPFSAMEKNTSIILALSKANLAGERMWLTSQNLADYSQALPAGTLTGVNGILEGVTPDADFLKRVKSADPTVTNFRYAAEAYDATILAALAAIVAGDDSGHAVSGSLREVSAGGIKCTSFGECLDVLTTRTDIDYDGISGPIGFNSAGDPRPVTYGLYRYEASNKFSFVSTVLAGK